MNDKIKDIRYTNREFDDLNQALHDFAKSYYPNTYQEFTSDGLGQLWIDMSSYVGDVLSYYTDQQFNESLIQYASERKNIISLAQAQGYIPKLSRPATVSMNVYAICPAVTDDEVGELRPDWSVLPIIEEGMIISSSTSQGVFRTTREVDFSKDTWDKPLDVKIYNTNDNGRPVNYILKKSVPAVAGAVTTKDFNISSPEKYLNLEIEDSDFIDIISVKDSSGRAWREVPYLAQETVFSEYKNTVSTDPNWAEDQSVRYLINLEKTPYRFTKRITRRETVKLQFGGGVNDLSSEDVVPSPNTIGDPSASSLDQLSSPINPSNFLNTGTYGAVPHNTTISVTYSTGGGESSNAPKDDLDIIQNIRYDYSELSSENPEKSDRIENVKNSIRVRNPEPATGGKSRESNEEIKRNAQAFFSSQDRVVTKEDYVVRALNLPERYGSVAKAFATQNSGGMDLYVTSYDSDKNHVKAGKTVKKNLKTYLSQYKMATDRVSIKDGFVINIKVQAEILVYNTYNKREVLLRAIDRVRNYFDSDNMNFSEPIIIGRVVSHINEIPGVQNVSNFEIINAHGAGYSDNIYNISTATKGGIIYPSRDPSIFEVKWPNSDIKISAR